MTSCNNIVDIIKTCIPPETEMNPEQLEQFKNDIIIIKSIIDKKYENKYITKTKSLENLTYNNDKYITRSRSEPKKIKKVNVKLYSS